MAVFKEETFGPLVPLFKVGFMLLAPPPPPLILLRPRSLSCCEVVICSYVLICLCSLKPKTRRLLLQMTHQLDSLRIVTRSRLYIFLCEFVKYFSSVLPSREELCSVVT